MQVREATCFDGEVVVQDLQKQDGSQALLNEVGFEIERSRLEPKWQPVRSRTVAENTDGLNMNPRIMIKHHVNTNNPYPKMREGGAPRTLK